MPKESRDEKFVYMNVVSPIFDLILFQHEHRNAEIIGVDFLPNKIKIRYFGEL